MSTEIEYPSNWIQKPDKEYKGYRSWKTATFPLVKEDGADMWTSDAATDWIEEQHGYNYALYSITHSIEPCSDGKHFGYIHVVMTEFNLDEDIPEDDAKPAAPVAEDRP